MAKNLFDISLQEASLMELLELDSYDELVVALKLAEQKVTDRILKTNGEWTKDKLNAIKRLINDEITASYGGLFEQVQKESVEVAKVAFGSIVAVGAISAALPKTTIEEILNPNRNIQGYTFKELFKVTEDNTARQLRVVVASGVSQGLPVNEIVRQYAIKSEKLSKGQISTVMRTVVAEARKIARHKAYEELEREGAISGYVYDATLDSDTTLYCRQHDSRKYYKPIKEIEHLINVHFNCRSIFRPIENYDITGNTRPSQFGETEAVSYEEWYLSQNKTFWRSTLRNRQYEAFLKGNYKVKSLADINKTQGLDSVAKNLL